MVETQKKVEELKKTYLSWSLHDSDVRREGIAIGKEEGRSEAKIEAARNMLLDKLPETAVAKYTGLDIKTVQQLAEQLKAEPVQAQ